MTLNIRFGRFRFEIDGLTAFIHLPFIGQAYIAPGTGMSAWDSWGALRACGELDRA